MSDNMTEFEDLLIGETDVFSFDFTGMLNAGETAGSPLIIVSVLDGTDPNPAGIVKLGPAMDISSTVLSAYLSGGMPDVTYCLTATVDTSEGRTLSIAGRVRIVSPCEL